MEITVIDDSDVVGGWNSIWTAGDAKMDSVRSMVKSVLKAAGRKTITRLNVVDHGSQRKKVKGAVTLQFGDAKVNRDNFDSYTEDFKDLTAKFSDKSIVHFCHCWAGKDTKLLGLFAQLWMVPVWGGEGRQLVLQRREPRRRRGRGLHVRPRQAEPQGAPDPFAAVGRGWRRRAGPTSSRPNRALRES